MEPERIGFTEVANGLRVFLGILGKRKWFVVGVTILSVAAAYMYSQRQIPVYSATASVILERSSPSVLSRSEEVVELGVGDYWNIDEYIRTQMEVLRSRRLAKRVVDRLSLSLDERFLDLDSVQPPLSEATKREHMRNLDAAALLMSKTEVTLKPQSQMVLVTVTDRDAKMAQQLANALVEEYRDDNLEYRSRLVAEAMSELRELLVQLRREKEEAEAHVQAYEKRFGVGNLDSRVAALRQRIELFTAQSVAVRMERINLEASPVRQQLETQVAELQRLLEQKDLSRVSEGTLVSDANLSRLKFQIVDLDVKVRDMEANYGPKWPALKAAMDQRNLLKQALQREARLILETKLEGLLIKLEEENDKLRRVVVVDEEFARDIERAKSEEAALVKIKLDYEPLTARRDEARQVFDEVNRRYARTALSSQVETNNIRIQDLAVEPTVPLKGGSALHLVAGLLLGLILGIGVAFFVEALDSSVKTREDVEAISGLQFLGMVPVFEPSDEDTAEMALASPELFMYRKPKASVSEHVRTVRTNLFFSAPGTKPRYVLVTSPGPREGKTTVACNLAAANAMAGSKTLLLDLDMRRPRAHRVMGASRQPGLTEAYQGSTTLDSVIQTTPVPGLDLMPCGALAPNPIEILESARFRDMMEYLLGRYDTVVVDSPPLLAVADAKILSSLMQTTVLVAKAGSTTKEALREAHEMLASVVMTKVGVVLNRFDVEKHSYKYYYYRSKRYGYYNYYAYTDDASGGAAGGSSGAPGEERSS